MQPVEIYQAGRFNEEDRERPLAVRPNSAGLCSFWGIVKADVALSN